LLALGCANIAAAFFGTMLVAGGFSRTEVNYRAGARTQFASLITAFVIALVVLLFAALWQARSMHRSCLRHFLAFYYSITK
jgi:sulfate permease, SulP family